jgi:hypothetical protein
MCSEGGHLLLRDGLDHVMEMGRKASCMGPETVVHLLGLNKAADYCGKLPQQRAELFGLRVGEFRDRSHVSSRFEDQPPHTHWSDAVLDQPMWRAVNPTARQRPTTYGQIACKTLGQP